MRAALITLTILLGLVDGCPIPTPQVKARLPAILQETSDQLAEAQHVALAPFSPIRDVFLISQRWALFSTTGGIRSRMWIEARGDASEPWTMLYRSGDDGPDYLYETLEYRRVRNTWNPNRRGPKWSYSAFCAWAARTIFLHEPRFQFVRVRMERGTVTHDGSAFVPSGDFQDVVEHTRADVLR
ncbi:MAG TPA: hypothetical protein VGL13_14315 [Polyangiaceae bacterium]